MVSTRRLSSEEGVAVELALQEDILDTTSLQVHEPIERGLSLEEMVEQGMFKNGDLAKLISVSKNLVRRLEAVQESQVTAIASPHFRAGSLGPSLDEAKSDNERQVQRLDLSADSVLPVLHDEDEEEYDVVKGLEPSDDWTPGWEKLADVTVVPVLKVIRKIRYFLYLGAFVASVAGFIYLIANTQLPGQ